MTMLAVRERACAQLEYEAEPLSIVFADGALRVDGVIGTSYDMGHVATRVVNAMR